MTSIFPTAAAGGLAVRNNTTGAALNPPAVENDYSPKPPYVMNCTYYGLPSDCTARIEPRQINAIVSELVALAECMDPNGPWDCALLTNLCRSFTAFRASVTPASLISDDEDNTIVLGTDGKLFSSGYNDDPPRGNGVNITTTSPFGIIPLGAVNSIVANVPARQALATGLRSAQANNNLIVSLEDQKFFVAVPPVSSVNGMTGAVIIPGGGGGGGDVTSAVTSSVAGHIAIFYNITGKVITTSGVPISTLDPTNRVLRTGDKMTGALTIEMTSPSLVLDTTSTGAAASLVGRTNGKDRWHVDVGDTLTESGGDVGSDFRVRRYGDDGVYIDTPFHIVRDTGNAIFNHHATVNGTIYINGPAGDGFYLGNAIGLQGASTVIYLDKTATSGQNNLIRGMTNGDNRWQIQLGDSTTEAGNNSGSDFKIGAWSDAGTQVTSLKINRNNSNAYFASELYWSGGLANNFLKAGWLDLRPTVPNHCLLDLRKYQAGLTNQIRGFTGNFQRWGMQLGDTVAEGGNNLGSNFRLDSYNDDGTFNSLVMSIRRNDNYMTYTGEAAKPGGGAWASTSDERIKNVRGPYTAGLREIVQLDPVRYSYKGNETDSKPESSEAAPYPSSPNFRSAKNNREFVGLVAQDTEKVMPELVKKTRSFIDGIEVADLRQIDSTPLIFALINAVKELTARVEQLEAKGV